jgi:hypothetical protein
MDFFHLGIYVPQIANSTFKNTPSSGDTIHEENSKYSIGNKRTKHKHPQPIFKESKKPLGTLVGLV